MKAVAQGNKAINQEGNHHYHNISRLTFRAGACSSAGLLHPQLSGLYFAASAMVLPFYPTPAITYPSQFSKRPKSPPSLSFHTPPGPVVYTTPPPGPKPMLPSLPRRRLVAAPSPPLAGTKVMANSGGNNESVCDVDMANNEFLDTYEYVIKSVQGANDELKVEIKELRKESVRLVQESNQLRDERDKLAKNRDKLKEERRLLMAERIDLKMDIDQFRREGEGDRKKLRQLGILLDED